MADIKKELNDIKNAVYGREVRSSIHDGIKKINDESEESKRKAEEAHEITQDLLDETFDSAALESNFEQRLNDEIANLQPEWTGFKNDVTAQLAQTDNRIFKSSLVNHKSPGFKVWWIDDDGHKGVYTKLAPWLREYGIKMSSAVITNRPHGFPIQGLPAYDPNSQFMSYNQMKELENEGIVEFVPHSHTHDLNHRYTDMTLDEIHDDMSTCKNIMRQLGWNYKDLVIPFGAHNAQVRDVARQYFRSAIDIRGGAFIPPINQFAMPRIGVDNRSTQEIIDEINRAYENNTLIILMSHVDQYGGLEESKMREVIEHVLTLGGEFVTSEEAINEFGNLLQLDENNTISYDGEIHGRNIGVYRNGHINYEPNAPITEFKQGTVTRLKVRQFETADYNMPEFVVNDGAYGFVEVHRDTNEDIFSFRKFIAIKKKYELISKWDPNNNTWGDWEFVTNEVILPSNSRIGNETPSEFPQGVVSIVYINDETATGTPYNLGGTLKTYRLTSDDSGVYQEFKRAMTGNKFTRLWLRHDDSWSHWEIVGEYIAPRETFNGNNKPTDFLVGTTMNRVRYGQGIDLPTNQGCIFKTTKLDPVEHQFTVQEVREIHGNRVFTRTAKNENEWYDWKELATV